MNWLRLKFYAGKLLNLIGLPSPVQQSEYESRVLNAQVSVKKSELYTVVSVNGLDIYLGRLTGKIDGVGRTRGIDYAPDVTPMSIRPAAGREVPSPRPHRQVA